MEVLRAGQGGPIQTGNLSYEVQNKGNVKNVEVNETKYSDKTELKEEDLKKAVEKLNTFLKDNGTYAEYAVHDKLKDIMITIRDSETKEIIRELPPKKILDMVAKMIEMVGILVDKRA
jgi:flagellar protein FlaG